MNLTPARPLSPMPQGWLEDAKQLTYETRVSLERITRAWEIVGSWASATTEDAQWDLVERLVRDAGRGSWEDRDVEGQDLRLANELARRSVAPASRTTGRELMVSYDLKTPRVVWDGGRQVEVLLGERGMQLEGATIPVMDGHDGPTIGQVVDAGLGELDLHLYVVLGRGALQDDLLAGAAFGDRSLGTSVQVRWDHDDQDQWSEEGGQLVQQGVTVVHLAFVDEPARSSRVQRVVPQSVPRPAGPRWQPLTVAQLAATPPVVRAVASGPAHPSGPITRTFPGARITRVSGRPAAR